MMAVLTELDTIGRLVLATVLGFVIGLEREAAGQSAGERTHALVALGSAAFGLLSINAFHGSETSRVAAGVVTGLGVSRAFSSSTGSTTLLLSAPMNRRCNLPAASTERLSRWPLHPRRPEH